MKDEVFETVQKITRFIVNTSKAPWENIHMEVRKVAPERKGDQPHFEVALSWFLNDKPILLNPPVTKFHLRKYDTNHAELAARDFVLKLYRQGSGYAKGVMTRKKLWPPTREVQQASFTGGGWGERAKP